MQAKILVKDPEKIEFTLIITMSLGEWLKVQKELPNTYESNKISKAVNDMTTQAQRVFWPERKDEADE